MNLSFRRVRFLVVLGALLAGSTHIAAAATVSTIPRAILNAAPSNTANLRLLPDAKNLTLDTVDVSPWYQPDVLSPAYLKYVKAGALVTLEYVVTDGAGSALAATSVTLNVNNRGGGETAIWTQADGSALAAATNSAYSQQITGTTNNVGHVTFIVKNNNSDAQSEASRSVLNSWIESSNGKELKGGFYPTIGAATEHVDRFWPHIVVSGNGGGSGIAPSTGGGEGPSQSCAAFGDASSLCPPISQLAMKVAGSAQATPVVQGQALLATSSKDLTFTFTSTSANAGRTLIVHFFDFSSGLSLTLGASDISGSTTCRSAEAASGICVITANATGGATFSATISGAQVGKLFKYQINGPAGFTSGFVTAMYSANTSGGETADLCIDRTRVCPSISRVSFEVAGVPAPVTYGDGGAGVATMPIGTTSLRFRYTSIPDYAGKFAHIQFFDFSSGLDVVVPSGAANSSTSCDPGPAAGRGCYLQLDGTGSASFTVVVSGATAERSFSYQVSGVGGFASPGVTVTARSAVIPACVTNKMVSASPSSSAVSGTLTSVTFKVVDAAGQPCQAKTVSVTFTGWGSMSTTSATTDASGNVTFSATCAAATADKSMSMKATTLTPKGSKVSAAASIKWLKVPPPPTVTLSASRGVIKVVIKAASGKSAVIAYTGPSSGSNSVSVVSASATYTVSVAKGLYTVTVTIGTYTTSKSVSVS